MEELLGIVLFLMVMLMVFTISFLITYFILEKKSKHPKSVTREKPYELNMTKKIEK